MKTNPLDYQSGFGNSFASEAVAGALPIGRNSPQRVAHGLYAELLSGSAFTAPRHSNLRSWLYRRQPSVMVGGYTALAQPWLKTGAKDGHAAPPDPMRWHPLPIPDEPADFVDGLRTIAVNGDADAQTGVAAHLYLVNRSMGRRAFVNADGEMLLVPQQGRLTITTELGILEVAPGEIALLPRGMAFKIDVDGPSRGYICENYGAPFRLPELGPIGSNGLANARAIAGVAGVDALFIGRADLALAMGHEDIRVDAVTQATRAIIAAARDAGKIAAMFVPNTAERDQFAAEGATCFVVGSDQSLMRQGAIALAAKKPA